MMGFMMLLFHRWEWRQEVEEQALVFQKVRGRQEKQVRTVTEEAMDNAVLEQVGPEQLQTDHRKDLKSLKKF